ncbi:MAG: hypothetical protein H7Y42_17215 [Chitinophagaceae bacterium]|nr:hypothetical protein [Chitinophagaceae bacterium]
MYTYTWKKYLPVIRLLLKRSATADQAVSLNRIDFEKGNRTRKPIVSFTSELVNGKSLLLNLPTVAKDLLEILLQDEVAGGLLRKNHYIINLNSDLKLTVKNCQPPAQEVGSEVTVDEAEK